MLDYKDFGKIFDIPIFNAGSSVEQTDFNTDSEKLQDFLFFFSSSNPAVDSVDIEIKLKNTEGIETGWKLFNTLPGTNGFIDNMMMGQMVGYGFKLKATNNSGVNITNFKAWLQGKAM